MSDPVKPDPRTGLPETPGRIRDENLSGKRRRPANLQTIPPVAPGATSTDSGSTRAAPGLDAALAGAPRPTSSPPAAGAPPSAPPRPASTPPTTTREISGATPRYVGSLDPDVPAPPEVSGSKPRPRSESSSSMPAARPAGLDPPVAPPNAKRTETDIPTVRTKKKKKGAGPSPMIGAVAALAVVVVLLGYSLWPSGAVPRSVDFEEPVPGMVDVWAGATEHAGVQTYVARIATTVAQQSRAVGDVRVYVAAEAAPHAVALPGREIVVSVGLLRRIASEAQLAAVLAHLIAHIESGDVDRAFQQTTGTDARARARTAATVAATADREHRYVARTGELLSAAGYPPSAFPDAHAALGARSGRITAFAQQHPVPPEALKPLAASASGRTGDVEFGRAVLDVLGRATTTPGERSANPPLPPRPPPTPKPDLSRPTDRKGGGAPPPPTGARSEPPTVPL